MNHNTNEYNKKIHTKIMCCATPEGQEGVGI